MPSFLKTFARAAAGAALGILTFVGAANAQSAKNGDANNDGAVTAADAQAVLQSLVELALPSGFVAAQGDANCDGTLTALDAQLILSFVVELDVARFCVGQPMGAAVAMITMDTTAATVMVGSSVELSATVRDSTNAPLAGRQLAWTSLDVSKATVSSEGLVTGKAQGNVVIVASTQGKSDSITVNVIAASTVLTVKITPSVATILQGGTVTVSASVTDAAGNPVTGQKITWSSSDTTKVKIDKDLGVATGVAFGSATISALRDGVAAASITVNVGKPGRANITWVGGSSGTETSWASPANWSPARVPVATDTVLVPYGTTHKPLLAAPATIAGLIVDTNTTLDIGAHELQVTGLALIDGDVLGTARVSIRGVNQGTSYIRGKFPAIAVNGRTVLVGPISSRGLIEVIATARLELNGHTVNGDGALSVKGALVMSQGSELVNIVGNARFFTDGAATSELTDGTLRVGGHFAVVTPPTITTSPFTASGRHSVVLTGAAKQIVADTGVTVVQFQELRISNTSGGVEFITDPADSTLRFRVQGNLSQLVSGDIMGNGRVNVMTDFTTIGGSVTLRNLAVQGVVSAAGSFEPDTMTFLGAGQAIPAGAPYKYKNVVVTGTASFRGTTSLSGGLTIGCLTTKTDCTIGGTASADVAGNRVTVGGDLRQSVIHANGRLLMNSARDSVVVRGGLLGPVGQTIGVVEFTTSNDWNAGVLRVGKNFQARGTGAAAAHTTYLDGSDATTPQTMRVFTGFNFGNLNVANAGGVVMNDSLSFGARQRIVGVLGDMNILTPVTLNGDGRINVSGNVQTAEGSAVSVSAIAIGSVQRVAGGWDPDTTEYTSTTIVQAIQQLDYRNVVVSGKAFVGGNLTISNRLDVNSAGELNLESRHLTVGGNARIQGILRMQDSRDTLSVMGDSMTFVGNFNADRRAYATAGVLRVLGGHLTGDSTSFYPTRDHKVLFAGENGALAKGGVYRHFEVAGTGTGTGLKTVTLRNVVVRGSLTAASGASEIGIDTVRVDGDAVLSQGDTVRVLDNPGTLLSVGGSLTVNVFKINPAATVLVGTLTTGGDLRLKTGASLITSGMLQYYGNYSEEGPVVAAGAPRQMKVSSIKFLVQPTNTTVNTPFNPAIAVEAIGFDGQRVLVSLPILLDNTDNTLTGTTRVISTNGVATFSGVAVNAAATNRTITANAVGSNPVSVTSAQFNVTP